MRDRAACTPAKVPKNPKQKLTPITSSWPFYKSRINISGLFLEAHGKDNIVCRFKLLGEIISDNEKHFKDNPFKDWCEKLNINQRPSPTVQSTSAKGQNKNSTTAENGESTDSILSKPAVKFVKAAERPTTDKVETAKKPAIRYVEMYRRTSKRSTVRGNQRNWNNLKSYQLGPEFVLHKKPCFNCGDFSHLANDYRRRVQKETTRSQNHAYKSPPLRSSGHRPHGGSMRPLPRPATHRVDRFPTDDLKFSSVVRRAPRSKMNSARPNKPAHSYGRRSFQKTTQDLMIILIQRVQSLEKELKSRTPIHKVDRGRSRPVMAWVPKKD
nr:hypothetical protein [Tanacetum cinerariifolium]